MAEPKRCPFCKSTMSIKLVSESYGMDGNFYDWIIYCTNCHLKLRLPADGFYGRQFYTKQEAIEEWNRRADNDRNL